MVIEFTVLAVTFKAEKSLSAVRICTHYGNFVLRGTKNLSRRVVIDWVEPVPRIVGNFLVFLGGLIYHSWLHL